MQKIWYVCCVCVRVIFTFGKSVYVEHLSLVVSNKQIAIVMCNIM
jgi:hypothetical protein